MGKPVFCFWFSVFGFLFFVSGFRFLDFGLVLVGGPPCPPI